MFVFCFRIHQRLRENWRTGRCRATLDERSFDVDARFHQIDERHMVYLSRSGMIDRKRLTVVRRSSMQVVQVRTHTHTHTHTNKRQSIRSIEIGNRKVIASHVQEIECPLHAFHFVGQVLVTAASDGVRFWNLTTGQLVSREFFCFFFTEFLGRRRAHLLLLLACFFFLLRV